MTTTHFLKGSSTSSYQVEGFNTNNDWFYWEMQGKTKDFCGQSTRHFELFELDFEWARKMNHNAHRFSIEWSRIEPKEGFFDVNALEHYRQVVRSLKEKNIKPIVTLHHFTNPKWFVDQGGWVNPKSEYWFSRYGEKVVKALGEEIEFWITINEPLVFAYYSYLIGLWPPGMKSIKQTWKVVQNIIKAHRKIYKTIHAIYKMNQWPTPMVSIAKNLQVFKVCPQSNNIFCHLGVYLRHHCFNLYLLKQIRDTIDFIGVNYYTREYISNDPSLKTGFFGGKCNEHHDHVGHLNTLSWDCCPEGLYEVLLWVKDYNKPIIISENGTCEVDDEYRWQFIKGHLQQVEKAK